MRNDPSYSPASLYGRDEETIAEDIRFLFHASVQEVLDSIRDERDYTEKLLSAIREKNLKAAISILKKINAILVNGRKL